MYRNESEAIFPEISAGFIESITDKDPAIVTTIQQRMLEDTFKSCKFPETVDEFIVKAIIKQNFDDKFVKKVVPILVRLVVDTTPNLVIPGISESRNLELSALYYLSEAKCLMTAIMLFIITHHVDIEPMYEVLDTINDLSCLSTSFTELTNKSFGLITHGLRCVEMAYLVSNSDFIINPIPVSEDAAYKLKSIARKLLEDYRDAVDNGMIKEDAISSGLIEDLAIMLRVYRQLPYMLKNFDVRYTWLANIKTRCSMSRTSIFDTTDTLAYKMLDSAISRSVRLDDKNFVDIRKVIREKANIDDNDDEVDNDIEEELREQYPEYFGDEDDDKVDIEDFKKHGLPRFDDITEDDYDDEDDCDDVIEILHKIFSNLKPDTDDNESDETDEESDPEEYFDDDEVHDDEDH